MCIIIGTGGKEIFTKKMISEVVGNYHWCACARPLWLGETIELPSKGRDLMLSVDLSGSMITRDMIINGQAVDRLTLVKYVMSDFIERRQGDRLGLILFADNAYLQSPLTQDRTTVAQFLKETAVGLVGEQTAIGNSIALFPPI